MDIVHYLPSKEQALDVIEITQVLSERATNALGNFEVQYAYDPASVLALERYVLLIFLLIVSHTLVAF